MKRFALLMLLAMPAYAAEPATVLIPLDLEHAGCESRKVVVTDGVPYCVVPTADARKPPYVITMEHGAPIAHEERLGPSHGYPNMAKRCHRGEDHRGSLVVCEEQ